MASDVATNNADSMPIVTFPDITLSSSSYVWIQLGYLGHLHTPSIGGNNGMDWGWDVGRNLGRLNDEYDNAWPSVHEPW